MYTYIWGHLARGIPRNLPIHSLANSMSRAESATPMGFAKEWVYRWISQDASSEVAPDLGTHPSRAASGRPRPVGRVSRFYSRVWGPHQHTPTPDPGPGGSAGPGVADGGILVRSEVLPVERVSRFDF